MPCAGGQEPYSIAIALLESGRPRPLPRRTPWTSAKGGSTARRGVFSSNAFRDNDQELQSRYFKDHPQGYELDASIAPARRFLQGSVLDPTLLLGEARYDVIFCRNLVIYLDSPSRVRVMATIDRLLAAEGLLIIGHADRIDLASTKPEDFADPPASQALSPFDENGASADAGQALDRPGAEDRGAEAGGIEVTEAFRSRRMSKSRTFPRFPNMPDPGRIIDPAGSGSRVTQRRRTAIP